MEKKQKGYLLKTLIEIEKVSKKRNEFTHRLIGYSNNQKNGLHFYNKSARGAVVKEKYTKITSDSDKKVTDEIGVVNFKLVRVFRGDEPWKQKT